MIERRYCMEFFRDHADKQFEHHAGFAWLPRNGSMISHRTVAEAMISSRDFLAAKKRADREVLLPAGPKIAVTGGLEFNDHRLIWDRLDKVHGRHSDIVLLHGGSPKGAEFIASLWADHRKVPQIAFKPDWTRHAKAAPSRATTRCSVRRRSASSCTPSTGIQDNLADKARKLGIPVWRFGSA
jgi:hypothetical protein